MTIIARKMRRERVDASIKKYIIYFITLIVYVFNLLNYLLSKTNEPQKFGYIVF